jgi:hypothetical protein
VKRLARLLIGVVAALLLVEVIVRLVFPQNLIMKGDESFFPGDPDLQFAIRPNAESVLARKDFRITLKSNSLGFRDIERGPKGAALRVLAQGDSATFGWGVEREETFEVQMEQMQAEAAARRGERPIEVINAGVPGYNLYQSILAIEKKGWKVDPDVIILCTYVQNDYLDNLNTAEWLERKEARGGADKEERPGLKKWLKRHSHAYVWVRVKYMSSYPLRRTWYKITRVFKPKQERTKYRHLRIFQVPQPPETEAEWRLAEELFLRLRNEVRARGKELLVVLFPSEIQVDRKKWEEGLEDEALIGSVFDLEAPNRRLKAIFGNAGIPTLDLLPVFRKATDAGEVLYLATDHHWNSEGNRLAARTILEDLRARGWLLQEGVPGGRPLETSETAAGAS